MFERTEMESGFSQAKFASDLLSDAIQSLITAYSTDFYSPYFSHIDADINKLYQFYQEYNQAVSQQFLSGKLALLTQEERYLYHQRLNKTQVDTLSLYNFNDYSGYEHILDEPEFNSPNLSVDFVNSQLSKLQPLPDSSLNSVSSPETASKSSASNIAKPNYKPQSQVYFQINLNATSPSSDTSEHNQDPKRSLNNDRANYLTSRFVFNLLQPALSNYDLVLQQVQINDLINIPLIVCNPNYGLLLVVCTSAPQDVLENPERSDANYLALPNLLNVVKTQIATFLNTKLRLAPDYKRKILSCMHVLILHEKVSSIYDSIKRCKDQHTYDSFYLRLYQLLRNAKQEQVYLASIDKAQEQNAKMALQLQTAGQIVDSSLVQPRGSAQHIFDTYEISTPFTSFVSTKDLKDAILALGNGLHDQDIHSDLSFSQGASLDLIQKSLVRQETELESAAEKIPLKFTKLLQSQHYAYAPQRYECSAMLDALKAQAQDHNQYISSHVSQLEQHTIELNVHNQEQLDELKHEHMLHFKPYFWRLRQAPCEKRQLNFLQFNAEHLNFIFDVRSCLLLSNQQSFLNTQVLLEKVIFEYVRLKAQSLDLGIHDPYEDVNSQEFSIIKAQHKRLSDGNARAINNLQQHKIKISNAHHEIEAHSAIQEQLKTHSVQEKVKVLIAIRHIALYQSVFDYLQRHVALLDLKDFRIIPVAFLGNVAGKEYGLDDLSALSDFDLILIDGAEVLSNEQVKDIQNYARAFGLYFGVDYREDCYQHHNILSQLCQQGASCLEPFYAQDSSQVRTNSGYDEFGRYLAQLWCPIVERNRHPDYLALPVLNSQAPVLELLRRSYLHHYFKDNSRIYNSQDQTKLTPAHFSPKIKPLSENEIIHNIHNQGDKQQVSFQGAFEESALFGMYLKRKFVTPSVGAFNICTISSHHFKQVILEGIKIIKSSFDLSKFALLKQQIEPELNFREICNCPSWKQAYLLINSLISCKQQQELKDNLKALDTNLKPEQDLEHNSVYNAVVSFSPAIGVVSDFILRHGQDPLNTNSQFVSLERMFYQNLNNLSSQLKMRLTPLRLRLSERIYLERCCKDFALEQYLTVCFNASAYDYVKNLAKLINYQELQQISLSPEILESIMDRELNLVKILDSLDPSTIKQEVVGLILIKGKNKVGIIGTEEDGVDLEETIFNLFNHHFKSTKQAHHQVKQYLDSILDTKSVYQHPLNGGKVLGNNGSLDYEHQNFNETILDFISGSKSVAEYVKDQNIEENSDLMQLLIALDSLRTKFVNKQAWGFNAQRQVILDQRLHSGIVSSARIGSTLSLSAGDYSLAALDNMDLVAAFLPWLKHKSDIHESFDLSKSSHCAILELLAAQKYLKQNKFLQSVGQNQLQLLMQEKSNHYLTLQALAPTVEERLCKLLAMAWLVQKEPALEPDFNLMVEAYLGRGEFTQVPRAELKKLKNSIELGAKSMLAKATLDFADLAQQNLSQNQLISLQTKKDLAAYQTMCSPSLEQKKINSSLNNIFNDLSVYKQLLNEISLDSHFNFGSVDFRSKGQSLRFFKLQESALNFIGLAHSQGLNIEQSCVFLLEENNITKEQLYLALQCAQDKLKLVVPSPKLQNILTPHYRNALRSLQQAVQANRSQQAQAQRSNKKEWVTFAMHM